jgi:hypothetical protein
MRRLAYIISVLLLTAGFPVMAAGYRTGARPVREWATLPAGTTISVRTIQPIDATAAAEGRTYPATIARDIMNPEGRVLIPRGSPATLVIRRVREGGTFRSSEIVLALDSIQVGPHHYAAVTEPVKISGKRGIGKNKRTAEMVGGGAALGTLIGAIAGGGAGAAIGAVAGAATGGGIQVATRGPRVRVPAEAVLNFQLQEPMHLREIV